MNTSKLPVDVCLVSREWRKERDGKGYLKKEEEEMERKYETRKLKKLKGGGGAECPTQALSSKARTPWAHPQEATSQPSSGSGQ